MLFANIFIIMFARMRIHQMQATNSREPVCVPLGTVFSWFNYRLQKYEVYLDKQ